MSFDVQQTHADTHQRTPPVQVLIPGRRFKGDRKSFHFPVLAAAGEFSLMITDTATCGKRFHRESGCLSSLAPAGKQSFPLRFPCSGAHFTRANGPGAREKIDFHGGNSVPQHMDGPSFVNWSASARWKSKLEYGMFINPTVRRFACLSPSTDPFLEASPKA